MSISIQCPGCEKKLSAKDELAGKRVKCPGCGQAILVPAAQPNASAPSQGKPPVSKKAKTQAGTPPLPNTVPDIGKQAPPFPRIPRIADSDRVSTTANRANLQTSARPESSPAEQGATPLRWLLRLGLSVIAALFLGTVGFGVAGSGFTRETNVNFHYSPAGDRTETGNGTLWFYGIELLKSNDINSFAGESNRIALVIVSTTCVVCGLCGGGLAFLALGRLTRRRQNVAQRA